MTLRTILVVDDSPENRKLVLHYLRAKGYAVEGASSAAEADGALATLHPDLVLVDIALPGEDGLGWVSRVRSTSPAPPPFVALTAHGEPDVHERARVAGCAAFLIKPVPLRDLLVTVEECLAGNVRRA